MERRQNLPAVLSAGRNAQGQREGGSTARGVDVGQDVSHLTAVVQHGGLNLLEVETSCRRVLMFVESMKLDVVR